MTSGLTLVGTTDASWIDQLTLNGASDVKISNMIASSGNTYITAAVLNATVTQPTGGGFLAVYPFNPADPALLPSTSNVNFAKGQTVPNLVIVPPGSVYDTTNSSYDFGLYFGGSGSTHVTLDVFGVFENV